jgi:pimeloyl-ACP methyl ester carboxylesterase
VSARAAARPTALAKPVQTGRLPINGVNYDFEVHGKGEPVLLLHGGLGSIEMLGAALEQLAQSRKVIAVDLHGHGRTALGQREWKLELQGDGRATLVKRLGHEQVDVIGCSMGGGVALRMAIQKPKSVRLLALVAEAKNQRPLTRGWARGRRRSSGSARRRRCQCARSSGRAPRSSWRERASCPRCPGAGSFGRW